MIPALVLASAAQQPLGEYTADDTGNGEGLNAHLQQADERLCTSPRVNRRGDQMMVVAVETAPRFTTGPPEVLFEGRYAARSSGNPNYDVSADGQRFLMIAEGETDDTSPPAQIVVVENWTEELKARVPTGQ